MQAGLPSSMGQGEQCDMVQANPFFFEEFQFTAR